MATTRSKPKAIALTTRPRSGEFWSMPWAIKSAMSVTPSPTTKWMVPPARRMMELTREPGHPVEPVGPVAALLFERQGGCPQIVQGGVFGFARLPRRIGGRQSARQFFAAVLGDGPTHGWRLLVAALRIFEQAEPGCRKCPTITQDPP